MMLVIATQVYENYAWNADGSIGTGENAYWKAKGGSEYKILGVPVGVDMEEVVSMIQSDIEKSNDYIQETIIGYNVQSDDYLSWFEKSQLEYEGEIEFAEPTIEYSDLVERYADVWIHSWFCLCDDFLYVDWWIKMKYDKNFVEDVMFLFDEEREPISRIAYIMNVSIDEIDGIICSQIANNIMEIV